MFTWASPSLFRSLSFTWFGILKKWRDDNEEDRAKEKRWYPQDQIKTPTVPVLITMVVENIDSAIDLVLLESLVVTHEASPAVSAKSEIATPDVPDYSQETNEVQASFLGMYVRSTKHDTEKQDTQHTDNNSDEKQTLEHWVDI